MLPEFPERAQLVLDIIRRDVKRPRKFPKPEYGALPALGSCALRWDTCKCPMGLHPQATQECPDDAWGFLDKDLWNAKPKLQARIFRSVAAFSAWFDSIPGTKENARLVMDFIWPKKKRKVS